MNRYRYILGTLLVLLSLVCFGCGKEKNSGIFALEDLVNEEGEFQYRDIPFGSPYEEVISQIPMDFETMDVVDSAAVTCYSNESLDFYGCEASLFLDFTEDKLLKTVRIQFKQEKADEEQFNEIFNEIADDLTELYGEAEISSGEGDIFSSETHSWDKGNTRLQAVLLKTETGVSGVIGLFKNN